MQGPDNFSIVICVRLKGGLGNQMFQYALGRTLALKNCTELLLDKETYLAHDPKRSYGLGGFNVGEQFAVPDAHAQVILETRLPFNRAILEVPDGVILDGYFQCERYFLGIKDVILHEFTPKLPRGEMARMWAAQIANTAEPVAAHFRRGDAVDGSPGALFHGTPDREYYAAAFERIPKTAHLFGFSDEPAWMKREFPEVTAVTGCSDAEDIWLMSLCRHAIIANSSFSLWGSWLGPYQRGGTCIAPTRWFLNEQAQAQSQDIVPKGYIRI